MKITLHPTTKIVQLMDDTHRNTVPARVWEGETDTGIPVNCFITRVVPLMEPADSRQAEFETSLQECEKPSTIAAGWPAGMVL